ncbi:hypothetical protein ABPG72_000243 [Tetrahymena utriculariae]
MVSIVQITIIILNYLMVHASANVSYIMHPNSVSLLDFKEKTSSVALLNCESGDGLYAFVASTNNGVHIVDLHNYYLPEIVSLAPSEYAQGCKVSNNILFIADQKQGLVIYNVSDKLKPKLISITAFTQNSFKPSYQYVLLSSDQKYIFCLSYGFVLTYDITDLMNPKILPFPLDFAPAPNSYTLRYDSTKRFIAIANHISGITILDISNINQQYIRCISNPNFITWDVAFTPDQKAFYVLDAYFGLYYADPSILYDNSQKGRVSLSFTLVIPVTDSLVMAMEISQDGSLLFIGHRSTGIKIYQLNSQNYKQSTFIQNLQASYMVLCINLSKNQNKYIYVTNGIQLIIFKLVQPNTNQDFPNLFNTFQSSLTFVSADQNKYSIQCTQKEVIASTSYDGVFIFDITDAFQPKKYANYIKQSQTKGTISIITTTNDFNTLLIASQQGGLVTFDISDRSNPKYKNQYQLIQNNYSYTEYTSVRIRRDGTKVVVGNSFYGVLVYMFDKPSDLSSLVLTNGYANQYSCGFERCDFTSDATKFACACREIGTIFFQLQPPGQSSTVKYAFNEIAVEQAIISLNDKLFFLANGFQGIFIIDITNFFEPKKLSQLVLQGWVQWVNPIFNDKYIVVSQVEKGQLILINIEDPRNPYEQQRIEFLDERSTASCLSPSNPTNLYFLGKIFFILKNIYKIFQNWVILDQDISHFNHTQLFILSFRYNNQIIMVISFITRHQIKEHNCLQGNFQEQLTHSSIMNKKFKLTMLFINANLEDKLFHHGLLFYLLNLKLQSYWISLELIMTSQQKKMVKIYQFYKYKSSYYPKIQQMNHQILTKLLLLGFLYYLNKMVLLMQMATLLKNLILKFHLIQIFTMLWTTHQALTLVFIF